MKPSHLTTLLALLTTLTVAVAAFSAVPATINYQGYLKNTDGTPVIASTSIRFSLYSSNPARNNPVWTETKSITPSNGIYSTQLGSATPIAAPFDVPYWLGVKVEGDAEMDLQELSSVPYARRAATADAAAAGSIGTAAIAAGAVTDANIGGTISAAKLDLSGRVAKAGDTMNGDLTMSGASINLPTTTTSAGMIRQGSSILLHTFGSQNFFAGSNAGNLTTTGTGLNTGVGVYSLQALSSGDGNSAFGFSALRNTTTGYYNSASGHSSLISNSTGAGNTAQGFYSLRANSTANQNSAFGAFALQNNTIGANNTAVGTGALNDNTTASGNTAVGLTALSSQSFNNGQTVWSSNNTAVGAYALFSNQPTATTNGIYNTALGYNAGVTLNGVNANTSGYNNTFIGANSGPGTSTQLTNATSIGYNTLVSQSNSLVLGGTGADAVKVGIGTQAPAATLTVVNSAAATKGLTVQAAASQSANLQEWQNSAGTALASISSAGTFTGNGSGLTGLNAGNVSAGILPIVRGGTGSATQNFVDLSTTQSAIAGNKTFTATITATELATTGNLTLPTTTATTGIIKSGTIPLMHTFGSVNFFAGHGAGNLTTTGTFLTASGSSTLSSNTEGDYNTATGAFALNANTTGNRNTASGSDALATNTTGSDNTATGAAVLYRNTTGNKNTANGSAALTSNTTASNNTAIGAYALYVQSYNNGGTAWTSHNTAIGYSALYSNQPTANTNGVSNTALGAFSLQENTTGSGNVGVGDHAGSGLGNNITGSNNTFIGAYSGSAATNLHNATAIGYRALVNQNNSIVLGGTGMEAVKVGVGTTSPTATMSIVNSATATKGLIVQGTAGQTANLQEWQDNIGASMLSVSSAGNIRNFNKDIYLRDGTDTNHGLGWYGSGKLFDSVSIDGPVLYGWTGGALASINAVAGKKILMKWDNGGFDFYGYARFRVLSSGSTSACLDSNNSISTCSSDARMKKDVVPLSESMDVLGALSKLRGVTFTWDKSNEKAANMADGRDLGMIAQEVEQVFPEVVHMDKDGYKSMDYPKLVAFLVEVNKAQQAQLDSLNKRLTALEAK